MATATALPATRLIDVDGLGALYRALVADGYRMIGPVARPNVAALAAARREG